MKRKTRINEDTHKEEIIEKFCKHLKKGFSEYSFIEYDYRDIEKFANELDEINSNKKQVEKIKKALRESFSYWEKMAFDILKDERKKFFFPLWIFYVKHRFNWGADNKKSKNISKIEPEANLSLDNDVKKLEKQII